MAIKKMDPTPYLMAGESVILKAHAKQDKLSTIEVALSYVILFLTIIGDCFIIGTAFMLKELKIKESGYILLLIALFVVHVIPFIFWFVYSIKKLKQKSDKWYALTEKRVLIIQDKKPISVTYVLLDDVTAVANGKSSITLYMDEEHVKLHGLEDVTAFADRIEMLVFGEDEQKESVVENNPEKEKKQNKNQKKK